MTKGTIDTKLIGSVEIVDKKLTLGKITKELQKQVKKETGYKGNIDDAVAREKFFEKYEVVPIHHGVDIVGLQLNYQLKPQSNSVKETKPASGCGPATSYRF